MELLVFRHAKSSWKDLSLADFDRPLKGRGKRDALRMGRFILDHDLLPDCILCSTAKRAVKTLNRANRYWGIDPEIIQWSRAFYDAEAQSWIQALRNVPKDKKRVMVVGHNPGLEDLIIDLCHGPVSVPEDGKLLPTAALARLTIETDWQFIGRGVGRLLSITRPRSLAER